MSCLSVLLPLPPPPPRDVRAVRPEVEGVDQGTGAPPVLLGGDGRLCPHPGADGSRGHTRAMGHVASAPERAGYGGSHTLCDHVGQAMHGLQYRPEEEQIERRRREEEGERKRNEGREGKAFVTRPQSRGTPNPLTPREWAGPQLHRRGTLCLL